MLFWNRYTKRFEEELVPGNNTLKWLYTSTFGKIILKFFVKNTWFSKIFGLFARSRISRCRIKNFVKKYNIDIGLFEKNINEYKNFDEFFCRKIKPSNLLFNQDDSVLCSPVDGRHLGFQVIDDSLQFFVKGENLNITKLLHDESLAKEFIGGSMIICRLAPTDYHRFHFPIDCVPSSSKCINGYLYSVSPIALMKNLAIFSENKRWLSFLKNDKIGKIAFIEVGATFVGSVKQTYKEEVFVKKGDEKGYFMLGGSTVIMLFKPNTVILCDDLLAQTKNGYELYVRCGDILGKLI